jgi:hypothetical protein
MSDQEAGRSTRAGGSGGRACPAPSRSTPRGSRTLGGGRTKIVSTTIFHTSEERDEMFRGEMERGIKRNLRAGGRIAGGVTARRRPVSLPRWRPRWPLTGTSPWKPRNPCLGSTTPASWSRPPESPAIPSESASTRRMPVRPGPRSCR